MSSAVLVAEATRVVETIFADAAFFALSYPSGPPDGHYKVEVEGEPPPCGAIHDPESGEFTTPPMPEMPVRMPAISDRQFAMGLWGDGLITYEACLAFVKTGDIPAPLQAIIDTLPDDDTGQPTPYKDALILLSGATEFRFDHPLVDTIRQAQDWTAEHLRERWAAWAAL